MSRVFTLLLAMFPRLAKLFYICRCPPFLCFSLILLFLLLVVGFRFILIPFWGSLNLVSRAHICFIGSFEPFKIRSNKLFTYPLTELFKT
jgi:hypothetical protein